jgi:hypothetical protein
MGWKLAVEGKSEAAETVKPFFRKCRRCVEDDAAVKNLGGASLRPRGFLSNS